MKYFLFFFLFLFLLKKFLRKYNAIYTLNLWYGKKGSGKTTIFVKRLLKYQKKGYTCYTDIPCNIPGIHKINSLDLSKFRTNFNSYIAMDEGGILFDNREFKSFPKGLTEWFKLQRHFKCIVDINSQSPDIDVKIKNLADNIYIVKKVGHFISWIRPIGRQVKLHKSTAEADSRITEDLYYKWLFSWKFVFIPKYWGYFNSFEVPHRPMIKSTIIPCIWIQDFKINSKPLPCPPQLQNQFDLNKLKSKLGYAPPI